MPTREYKALFEFDGQNGKRARIWARIEAESHAEALNMAEEALESSVPDAVLVGVYVNE